MRRVIIAAALLVGGCSGTGIVAVGPDTYNLTKQIMPVAGGESQAATSALTEVNAFCDQKGLIFAPTAIGPVASGLNPPSTYSVTFQCLSPNGPTVADPRRYVELVRGTSTRDEAVAKLGPPQGTSDIRGAGTLLQWFDNNPAHPFRVAILFGPDGRMIKVTEVLDQ